MLIFLCVCVGGGAKIFFFRMPAILYIFFDNIGCWVQAYC